MVSNQAQKKISKKQKGQGFGEMIARSEAEAMSAWMVVRPLPGKEAMLMAVAKAEGFATYRPMVIREKQMRRSQQTAVTTDRMFPGYILVQAQAGLSWRIFSLPGVQPGMIGVLKWAFLDVFVSELRARERDGIIDGIASHTPVKRVRKIQTVSGLVDAIIENPIDLDRVSLVTGLFNGAARVTCSLDELIRH